MEDGDGLIMAEVGTISIAVWRKDSVMSRFRIQRQALENLAARHPGETGFLCVVEETSGAPGNDVRQASARMFDELGTKLKGIAMIIEGTGFRSSLVRSVASGIVMMSRKRSVPMTYVATVPEGAAWMAQHLQAVSAAAISDAVEHVRTKLDG